MSNVGKKLQDHYCNGYFGRRFDLANSTIEGEGEDWIVIRTSNNNVDIAVFTRNEKEEMINTWGRSVEE